MDEDKNKIAKLQNQLTIARNEINKLRQQMRNLQYMQQKDIEGLAHVLRDFRCEGCRRQATEENNRNSNNEARGTSLVQLQDNSTDAGVKLPIIGLIRTLFPEKRAVPRQSSIGSKLRAVIELNSDAFTNPEHALEGLSDYSHMWVLYHFHKNSSHPKAKVAPPRLGGERVGVFSTRSPHRPCPIGLSLVEIDKIENATVAFYGTDMVDGTPVLDIKPYIPFYDAPISSDSGRASAGLNETVDFYNSRQEPDGEESELEMLGAAGIGVVGYTNNISALPPSTAVKVPNWVVASHRLSVCFNERAISQLQELQVQRECITDILEADPRSVYLRTKHGSQIFTFQLSEVTVTCKFDDKAGTVTVVQVRRTENVQDNDEISEQC